MVMVTIEKCEFGQLNVKRYILPNVVKSLPHRHIDLQFIEELKISLPPTAPEKLIKIHEFNLIRFEQGVLERNERMIIINCVLLQQAPFYKRGTLKRSQFQISNNIRDFLLLGRWRKI